MAEVILNCFKCGAEMKFVDRVGRREECPACGEDAHVCLNCAFYDAKAYNECREPAAEVTAIKDRANHCEYFQGARRRGGDLTDERAALRAAAEALFKKK